MLADGRLGKLLHIEGNFCGPSVYRFGRDHWRQDREEGPAGGMTGRGVHVVDAMLYLAGAIDSVYAQSFRLVQDFGVDDTTSMLFRFKRRRHRLSWHGHRDRPKPGACRCSARKGWAEVGDVEHLTTWQMKVCFIDPANIDDQAEAASDDVRQRSAPSARSSSISRAPFRQVVPLAVSGGDEVHNVAVLEAIVESARRGAPVSIPA